MSTVQTLFADAVRQLEPVCGTDAAFEADCLLDTMCGVSKTGRLANPHTVIPSAAQARLADALSRRKSGEPLQYILGSWDFYGRSFAVGHGVLIPRPETEQLVELAMPLLAEKPNAKVLDLCAGSGCLGLTIALQCPQTSVFLLEKYDAAFSYLRLNAERLCAPNVTLIQADAFNPPQDLPLFDLLLSNPPYIPASEIPHLQREVRCEPHTALDGGADGLDFYRIIAARWMSQLSSNADIFLECGDGQGDAVAALFSASSAKQTVIFDTQDIDRFVHIHI